MEIIKKITKDGKKLAWVTINNITAQLISYNKETDSEILNKVLLKEDLKERLEVIQDKIKLKKSATN